MEPEARIGLLGEYLDLIEPHTEADAAAVAFQLLAGFGSIIGRHAGFEVEASRHFPNLFVCIVGQTAKGRKGVSFSQAMRPLAIASPSWYRNCVASGLSSGEGLIYAVRDRSAKKSKRGEPDPGVKDKRLLVVEQEFASTLNAMRREGNTLTAALRMAWDTGNLRTLTKNSPTQATGAHVAVITHITRDELIKSLTSTDAANGFANRFLFVFSERSKLLPEGGRLTDADVRPVGDAMREMLNAARKRGPLEKSDKAKRRWACVYEELSEGGEGLLGAVTARSEAQVMRLAVLYALLEGCKKIQVRHIDAGLAAWTYCEQTAAYLFSSADGDPKADRVYNAVRAEPNGLTRMEIRALFGGHIEKGELDDTLGDLAADGLIERRQEKTLGRPVERWIASPERKQSKPRKSGGSRRGVRKSSEGGNP